MFLQVDMQPEAAESTQPEHSEAGPSNPCPPGLAVLDSAADAGPAAAESTEPGPAEQQTNTPPQKESASDNSEQSLPNTPAKEKPKTSRRKLDMSLPPPPHDRNLRSSSASAAKLASSPQPTKKTKSPRRPADEEHAPMEELPAKKPRGGNMEPVAERQREESEETTVPETPLTGLSCCQIVSPLKQTFIQQRFE